MLKLEYLPKSSEALEYNCHLHCAKLGILALIFRILTPKWGSALKSSNFCKYVPTTQAFGRRMLTNLTGYWAITMLSNVRVFAPCKDNLHASRTAVNTMDCLVFADTHSY